jgi:hypothetical protein
MQREYSNPSFPAPRVIQGRDHLMRASWVIRLLRRYLQQRGQRQRRAEGIASIRKLPLYLQEDVGIRVTTDIDR